MGEGNWNESDLWQREAEENGLQTEPELQNAVQSPKQIRKTCRREVRRVCNVLGWALAFFSVRACHMQIKLQYRKTRLTVLIGGVIYIATAAARNVLLAPARVADRFHDPSRYSPGSGRNGLCLGFRAEPGFGQCGAADLDAGQRPLAQRQKASMEEN